MSVVFICVESGMYRALVHYLLDLRAAQVALCIYHNRYL